MGKLCDEEGELHLNRIRGEACALAPALGLQSEFAQLDQIIGAFLGTRETRLTSPAATARSKGLPYDDASVKRCTILAAALRSDYLGALRALNRYDDLGPIIRAFAFAQRVTAACVAMTVDEAIRSWASCYAFVEAGAHARLTLPQAAANIVWRNSIPAPADYWALVESGGGSGARGWPEI